MSRRKSNSTQPSLFPFLAVLVSTMGALIFLLLVISRQVQLQRNQEAARAHEEANVEPELPPLELPPLPPVPELKQYPEVAPLPPLALAPVSEETLPPVPPIHDPTAKLNRQKQDLERKLAEVEASLSRPLGEKERLVELESEKKRIQLRVTKLEEELTQRAIALADAEVDLKRLENELLRRRNNSQRVSNKYSIVPYEGEFGTKKRPIFLECVEQRIVLQPEGVALVAGQLGDPGYAGNALALVVEALMHEIRSDGGQGEPYPLFVVRPGGVEAFQAAWHALGAMDLPFGFELVDSDIELDYPEPNAAIREAAIRILKDSTGFAIVWNDGYGWQPHGRSTGLIPGDGANAPGDDPIAKYSSLFGGGPLAGGGPNSDGGPHSGDGPLTDDGLHPRGGPHTGDGPFARLGSANGSTGLGVNGVSRGVQGGDAPGESSLIGEGSAARTGAERAGQPGTPNGINQSAEDDHPFAFTGDAASASPDAPSNLRSLSEGQAGGIANRDEFARGVASRLGLGSDTAKSLRDAGAAQLAPLSSGATPTDDSAPGPFGQAGGSPSSSSSQAGSMDYAALAVPLPAGGSSSATDNGMSQGELGGGMSQAASGQKVVDSKASKAGMIRFLARPVRREIPVEIQAESVTMFIGQQPRSIHWDTNVDRTAREILIHASQAVREWGPAPERCRWEPVLSFHVRPDGLQSYYQLRFSLLPSGIEVNRKLIDWNDMVHESQLLRGDW